MKISVLGCGYLGAVHAVSLVALGHDVVGIDVDGARIDALSSGLAPIHEPGLDEALRAAIATGRLRFSADVEAAAGCAVHFITVGTPQRAGEYAADLSFVEGAVAQLAPHLASGDVVVGKSTVPVGTASRLSATLATRAPTATLVWSPEFLREGLALADSAKPDRLVYGVPPGAAGERATAVLDELYAPLLGAGVPRIITDLATAELVKVAANAFLATKVSFINAMADVADASGADVQQLAAALGYDARIGRSYLSAGIGYGGGCLPKDLRAFVARADELGVGDSVAFLRAVDSFNTERRGATVERVRTILGGKFDGARIAVLGLAFKPNSDDVRDSPALDIAAQLAASGARVTATDPVAIEAARALHPELSFEIDPLAAADGADLVLVLTEWDEYRELDPELLGDRVATREVLDGRNCLSSERWRSHGWRYHGTGRP